MQLRRVIGVLNSRLMFAADNFPNDGPGSEERHLFLDAESGQVLALTDEQARERVEGDYNAGQDKPAA